MCVDVCGDVCVMCVCVVEMQWYGAIGAINGTKMEPKIKLAGDIINNLCIKLNISIQIQQ
jgi:hypothetical protein